MGLNEQYWFCFFCIKFKHFLLIQKQMSPYLSKYIKNISIKLKVPKKLNYIIQEGYY